MGSSELVTYEKRDGLGMVTLNRPEALNVFSVKMRDRLYEVLRAIGDDDEVRAAVLGGAGEKAFCAGADLSEFLTAPPPVAARKIRFGLDLWGLFLNIPQPLIAALHGYVIGSGLEMALCCDLRIAAANARFGLPETSLGIIPAAGGTQTLPRAVGPVKALEMLLTNRWIEAEEAHRIGLVNQVVPQEDLKQAAVDVAKKIASYDPAAVRLAKQAIRRGADLPLDQGLDLERVFMQRIRNTAVARGGQASGRR